jgi:ABC-type multidrug transport system ATPase subunit
MLGPKLIFGRSTEADVQLADTTVSRSHLAITHRSDGAYEAEDLGSRGGSLVNGRYFDRHELVFGDRLQIGPFLFQFTGHSLDLIEHGKGGAIQAIGLGRRFGKKITLAGVNLVVEAGQFVGILGMSGAGKSTLLDALSGMRVPSEGSVLFDGRDLYRERWPSAPCGYVPQDDIVHRELTVAGALHFTARLRLPGDVAPSEIDRLVAQTIRQLGLEERAQLRVARLSGGQRKRVSIGAELLSKPRVLFLDEPSSGLDPSTESKLMELLRELANLGCTTVCTTHVMENVYLMDRVAIVSAGRLVFMGPPNEALTFFEIPRFAALYDRLSERPAEQWQELFVRTHPPHGANKAAHPSGDASARPASPPDYWKILIARQWALLASERKNVAMLLGQPALIGLMVAWMADNVGLKLFLAYLATFWFGCSNAAQEIVKESAIYRRERLVGLPRRSYLLAKFAFFAVATSLQAVLFFGCIHLGQKSMEGSALWQIACLLATAWSAVAIGLAISAVVPTTTQAVMIVPLILLPQIVFSGYVLPSLAKGGGAKKLVSEMMPSYSSQKIMDASVFWNRQITPELTRAHPIAFQNIESEGTLKLGAKYSDSSTGLAAVTKLLGWAVLACGIAWVGLRKREKST